MIDPTENSDRKYRYHNRQMSAVSEHRLKKAIVRATTDAHFESLNVEIDLDNRQWMRELLREILERLPDRQKQALILCEGMGLTFRDAAARLGCSKSTAQRELKSALKFAEEYIKNN